MTTPSTGILILGYNRPLHLQSVLESLRLQGVLQCAHVWLDGTQNRGEYVNDNAHSVEIAKNYKTRELRAHRSHLGIEKMMLDGLEYISTLYNRVIILEDDCFPLEGGIKEFEKTLDTVEDEPEIFSVYGHHFGVEPANTSNFPRFQGWGWAAYSQKINLLLPELRRLFMMSEESYIKYIAETLTDDIVKKLDVTPGRDVLNVLNSFFSWDSATAFLSAKNHMLHRRTTKASVVNTGLSKGIGHFQNDTLKFRSPPFNMITVDEAWARYDRTTEPCRLDRATYGLDGLDRIIRSALPKRMKGHFIEIGANDGVSQTNSALLEAAGWTGIMIEPVPRLYARCLRSRPNVEVVHAACVSPEHGKVTIKITDIGLMSFTTEANLSKNQRKEWIKRGKAFAEGQAQDIEVPAKTLSRVLDDCCSRRPDLLLLDVEGAEISVLKGLDFFRHGPAYIVAEDAYDDSVKMFLEKKGYQQIRILLERKFTRDCLYTCSAGEEGETKSFLHRLRKRLFK